MKDIASVNGIKTFYFIFLNANIFKKSVTVNIQDDWCKLVYIWIRICNMVLQTSVVQVKQFWKI
jgi:hypothetical protein